MNGHGMKHPEHTPPNSEAVRRFFLGWSKPPLHRAADWLLERTGGELNNTIVAVPGTRAGRRLLELLVERAAPDVLIAPRIVTIGRLPELLYRAKRPFADDLTQQLTWLATLRESGDLLPAIMHRPPEDNAFEAWQSLVKLLVDLHRELSAERLQFSDVTNWGERQSNFRDLGRWRALAGLQERYLARLDDLQLWDLQTARLFAIEFEECTTEAQIIVLGAVDLNRTQRAILEQVREHVTILIAAPEELSNRFDAFGCLHDDEWVARPVNVPIDQVHVVDDPGDQAMAVVQVMANWNERFATDEMTVGIPNANLLPPVRQCLRAAGVSTVEAAGQAIEATVPARLCASIADYVESQSYEHFATLVRHPFIECWLRNEGLPQDWLASCDLYASKRLPSRVGTRLSGSGSSTDVMRRVNAALRGLLGPLYGPKRRLSDWGQPLMTTIVSLCEVAETECLIDEPTLAAFDAIRAVWMGIQEIPDDVQIEVDASQAIRLAQSQLAARRFTGDADVAAIELLGWLELPLDDAKATVICGFNEGTIPSSRNADLFLPDQLRHALALEDNTRRYARDAYALRVLMGTRKSLHLIAGRRSSEGDPLVPSRLLFSARRSAIPQRVSRLLSSKTPPSNPLWQASRTVPHFSPPRPEPLPSPVETMRVTEFRDYLACPYRYYLRHRLQLNRVETESDELDAGRFGSIIHSALQSYGNIAVAGDVDGIDVVETTHILDEGLDDVVRREYGSDLAPAVRIQVEQARLRLARFASWQVDWYERGWRILHVETGDVTTAPFSFDDARVGLRGRIDRIDRHETTGEWIIWDYKTSDSGKSPEQTHRVKECWVDLQLPLYRHLIRGLGADVPDGPPKLGYVLLPRAAEKSGHRIAEWSDVELRDADRAAADVVRKVQAEEFWPPAADGRRFPEFAAVCLDNWLGPNIAEQVAGGVMP